LPQILNTILEKLLAKKKELHEIQLKEKQRIDEAMAIVKANEENALKYFESGHNFYKMKKHEKALTYFDSALRINYFCKPAIFEKGKILYERKKYDQAANEFARLRELKYESNDLNFLLSDSYAKASNAIKKTKKAEKLTASNDLNLKPIYKQKNNKNYVKANESNSRGCFYKGHQLFVGSRGGCYYIAGNSKEYVDRSFCANCF
jgi:tetratricopeptide (TPR) repeat protein